MKRIRIRISILLLFTTIFLFSCLRGLYYDDNAYKQGRDLQTESNNLLAKATDSYNNHATEVDTLKSHINKALAYEAKRGEKSNAPTIKMWQNIKKDSSTLNKMLLDWKNKGVLKAEVIDVDTLQLNKLLSIIPEYENYKIKKP